MIYLVLTWLAAPLLYLRLALARSPARPHRVLVIQTAKIGDFVCTTPLLRELRRGLPQARISLLLHPVNMPLARHNPHVDELLPLPVHALRGLRGRLWLVQAIMRRGIDTVICVSPSLSAWLAPLWAGVARRMAVLPDFGGTTYRLAAPLLTIAEAHRRGRRVTETHLALLAAIGIDASDMMPEAFASPDSEAAAERILPRTGPPAVGLGVSAGNKLKELGGARLSALMRGLLGATEARVVLIGGPDDRRLAAEVAAQFPRGRVIDAAGAMGLEQLPALLGRLAVYVGVDSGITYLADACGIPVVDLMGPADPDDQRPFGRHATILATHLRCAPCSHAFSTPYTCSVGTRACVLEADLSEIVRAAVHLLQRHGREG